MPDNFLQNLQEIFNQRIFRIPDFQRGYSWSEKQLNDFWNDLKNLKDDAIHYTGMLTFENISSSSLKDEKWQDDRWLLDSGYKAVYIIDGQQRITTVLILLNEILSTVEDNQELNYHSKNDLIKTFLYRTSQSILKSYVFGYEKDDPSDQYFKTHILTQESAMSGNVASHTLYTKNLENAKNFFRDKIKGLSFEQKNTLFKKLISNLKFNCYNIDNELDIYITFETMNNRGKPLSTLELLKNRLIYLSTLYNNDNITKRLRKDINETWKTVYKYLGKNPDNVLDDDEFLQDHWRMYFTYNRNEAKAFAIDLLNKQFTTKSVLEEGLKPEDISKYVLCLAKSAEAWFWLKNPQYYTKNRPISDWLEKMDRLGWGAFKPLAMAVLISNQSEEDILKFLQVTERFCFVIFMISERHSSCANQIFYNLAHEFYLGNKTIEDVLKTISENIDGTEDDEDSGYIDIMAFKNKALENFIKNEGFFSWKGLRYFLFEYECSLKPQNGEPKLFWDEYKKRSKEETIEHIYPQNPAPRTWKKFSGLSPMNKKFALHNLGNLLLLSRKKNSALQNYEFSVKAHSKENENRYDNGSYSEIEVSRARDWTVKKIQQRALKMLKFMEDRWNIKLSEWGISYSDLIQYKKMKKKK